MSTGPIAVGLISLYVLIALAYPEDSRPAVFGALSQISPLNDMARKA